MLCTVLSMGVGWLLGLKCMIVRFMCFELQSNRIELNILQAIFFLFAALRIISQVYLPITRHETLGTHTCQSTLPLQAACFLCTT
jgi:hypothetical protein